MTSKENLKKFNEWKEKGKYDRSIGYCYFIRTKEGGWFGANARCLWWCELDVDNRWYNQLIEELNQWDLI